MQDLCPVCLKSGVKKKIKLLQINLNEAVLACEAEKCAWPFGYEDFTFFSRPVGKTWSCYWDDHKPPTSKATQNVSSSLELPSFNLTSRLSKNTLPDHCYAGPVPINSASYMQNTNTTSSNAASENNVPLIDEGTDLSMSDLILSEQILSNQVSDSQPVDDANLDSVVSNSLFLDANTISMNDKIHNSPDIEVANFISSEKDTDSIKKQHSLPMNTKESIKNESVQNISCIPKMRTDKDVSTESKKLESKCESLYQKRGEIDIMELADNMDNSNILPNTQSQLSPILSLQKTTNLEMSQHKLNNNTTVARKSNINVTTMRIDNLPLITVTYELPNMQQDTDNNDPSISGSTANVRPPNKLIKNIISSGQKKTNSKQFAKFSFNDIKKKRELNKGDDVTISSHNNTDLKLELGLSDFKGKQLNSSNEKDNKSNIVEEDNCRTFKSATHSNSNNSDWKQDLKLQDVNAVLAGVNGRENFSTRDSIRITESNALDIRPDMPTDSVDIQICTTTKREDSPNNATMTKKLAAITDNGNESTLVSNIINNFSDQITKSVEENMPNQFNISVDSSVLNTSINVDNSIDTVLDDFLSNNDEECENINDDWINSLLF